MNWVSQLHEWTSLGALRLHKAAEQVRMFYIGWEKGRYCLIGAAFVVCSQKYNRKEWFGPCLLCISDVWKVKKTCLREKSAQFFEDPSYATAWSSISANNCTLTDFNKAVQSGNMKVVLYVISGRRIICKGNKCQISRPCVLCIWKGEGGDLIRLRRKAAYDVRRIPVIKLRRMIDVGHVARMGENGLCIQILGGKTWRKVSLARPRRRWDDILIYL
jgi:hypothetical protein